MTYNPYDASQYYQAVIFQLCLYINHVPANAGGMYLENTAVGGGQYALALTFKDNFYIYVAYKMPTSGINGAVVSDQNISCGGDVFSFGNAVDAAVKFVKTRHTDVL